MLDHEHALCVSDDALAGVATLGARLEDSSLPHWELYLSTLALMQEGRFALYKYDPPARTTLVENNVLPNTAMYNQVPSTAMVSCIETVKHAIQTLLECVQHSAKSAASVGPLNFEQVDACRDRLLVSLEQMERCMRACQTQFQHMIKLDTGDRDAFHAHFELLRVPFKAEKAAVDGLYDFHTAIGDMIMAIKAIDDVLEGMDVVPETVVAVRAV
ncbi:hypothetical protein CYMTET_14652 [Cymbomonas tetramitiformis]|uniref:Uncharacterized protein n=1 Tax=Cymbomonas tetramitiformis TaxID=36881 RepID=A0AAE0GG54_9CHLO|nr:hypothetical protein CYMTET_14652 [Cymbomonas tetramitiformis]